MEKAAHTRKGNRESVKRRTKEKKGGGKERQQEDGKGGEAVETEQRRC